MDLGLRGQTAFITGGSMGIGKAIAQQLASEGVNVVLAARRMEHLEEAAAEIRSRLPAGSGELACISVDTSRTPRWRPVSSRRRSDSAASTS